MSEFFKGLGFVVDGWRLSRQLPALRKWIYIPFIIDVMLLWAAAIFGFTQVSTWAGAAVAQVLTVQSGLWYSLTYYAILFFFLIGFSIVVMYSVFVLAAVIASPFNALLAERILMLLGKKSDQSFEMGRWIGVAWRMLRVALVKAVVFSLLGLFIFGASFIPGVNVAASFLAFLIVAFDSMDYGFEALEWSFRDRLKFFRANFAKFAGMAVFLMLTGLIPGLTLLLLPWSVIGATRILAESSAYGSRTHS